MKRPLNTIAIIPFTEAFLCPEPVCRAVSNMPICPSCTVTTIPLHIFIEQAPPDESGGVCQPPEENQP